MEQEPCQMANAQTPPVARSVNSDMRRAAANLALVINECGLSQSELSRRSGISRQLINGWARQRVSVTLSSTVGQLLGMTLYPHLYRTLRYDPLRDFIPVAPSASSPTFWPSARPCPPA